MDIRYLEPSDLEQIGSIYNRHFSDMEYPDFVNDFAVTFVAHENEKIIAVGGLKPMVEAIVLTDLDESVRTKRDALLKIFDGVTYAAAKLKYKEIHAFAYDMEYAKHLIKRMGFRPISKSKLLVMSL